MAKIALLDPQTANQIAAGEVVERPASVVKELVENSIDAGATRIEVTLQKGGIDLIQVTDNGTGMDPEDALLALERHATSKIRKAEDLQSIHTLGFRGEALPSIASVSRFELRTRTAGSLSGVKVTTEGGLNPVKGEEGCPVGTTILVRDLFFNTPARRKFLKSPGAEGSQITDLLQRFALSHPHIAFKLVQDRQTIFHTPGNNRWMDALVCVYGKDTAKQLLPLEAVEEDGIRVEGFVGIPDLTRGNRLHQSFFVNGRYIKSKLLADALEEGYHTLIPTGRFPVAVIALTVDARRVDVNVHPTKMEVRFDKGDEVFRLVAGAVRRTLLGRLHVADLKEKPKAGPPAQPGEQAKQTSLNLGRGVETWQRLRNPPNSPELPPDPEGKTYVTEKPPGSPLTPGSPLPGKVQETAPATAYHAPMQTAEPVILPVDSTVAYRDQAHPAEPVHPLEPVQTPEPAQTLEPAQSPEPVQTRDPGSLLGELVPLAQLHNSYILAQGEDGLYIIDQHAAHERLNYDRLMARLEAKEPSQQLLAPITVELGPLEQAKLIEHILWLHDLGFVVEHFGGFTFLIREVPVGLEQGREEETLRNLLALLDKPTLKDNPRRLKEEALAEMSCKDAVKARMKMTLPEMDALLQQLSQTANPNTCPHGRPIVVRITLTELERRFKRI